MKNKRICVVAVSCIAALAFHSEFLLAAQETSRVSMSTTGGEPNHTSDSPVISLDGRYVAFNSYASDLVTPNDPTTTTSDIFVWDRVNKITERVSIKYGTANDEPDGHSYDPSISADGNYIAFESQATNLLESIDTLGRTDVFVRDRQTGTTERVSEKYGGGEPNGSSYDPSISANNGRFVAFQSAATDLLAESTSVTNIFVRDRQENITEIISVTDAGGEPDENSNSPSISADGRFVAFQSMAKNLAGSLEPYFSNDIFVRDRQEKTTERISVNTSGGVSNGSSQSPEISPDGRYVVFGSNATDLVDSDNNSMMDVFIYDRQEKNMELVSVNSSGEQQSGSFTGGYGGSLSADGRYVAFSSDADNLVDNDTNVRRDLFRRDRVKGITIRSSVNNAGEEQNGYMPDWPDAYDMSGNGQYLVFGSNATNLVDTDTSSRDIFLREEDVELPPEEKKTPWILYLPNIITH